MHVSKRAYAIFWISTSILLLYLTVADAFVRDNVTDAAANAALLIVWLTGIFIIFWCSRAYLPNTLMNFGKIKRVTSTTLAFYGGIGNASRYTVIAFGYLLLAILVGSHMLERADFAELAASGLFFWTIIACSAVLLWNKRISIRMSANHLGCRVKGIARFAVSRAGGSFALFCFSLALTSLGMTAALLLTHLLGAESAGETWGTALFSTAAILCLSVIAWSSRLRLLRAFQIVNVVVRAASSVALRRGDMLSSAIAANVEPPRVIGVLRMLYFIIIWTAICILFKAHNIENYDLSALLQGDLVTFLLCACLAVVLGHQRTKIAASAKFAVLLPGQVWGIVAAKMEGQFAALIALAAFISLTIFIGIMSFTVGGREDIGELLGNILFLLAFLTCLAAFGWGSRNSPIFRSSQYESGWRLILSLSGGRTAIVRVLFGVSSLAVLTMSIFAHATSNDALSERAGDLSFLCLIVLCAGVIFQTISSRTQRSLKDFIIVGKEYLLFWEKMDTPRGATQSNPPDYTL